MFLVSSVLLASYNIDDNRFGLRNGFLGVGRNRFCICDASNNVRNVSAVGIMNNEFACRVPYRSSYALVVIFPGFSRRPVFTRSKRSIRLGNSTSRLGRVIMGNAGGGRLVAGFHGSVLNGAPPRRGGRTRLFVRSGTGSTMDLFLVGGCFVTAPRPSCGGTFSLLALLRGRRPGGVRMNGLGRRVSTVGSTKVNAGLPAFASCSAGKGLVSDARLADSPITIVCA